MTTRKATRTIGERRASVARRLAREHGEQRQDRHLDEDVRSGPAVLAPVELVVERPVRPRDPDDREDDEELEVAAERHRARELVRRLRDDDDVDEVGEELEEADPPFGLDLTVRPGRLPEPSAGSGR